MHKVLLLLALSSVVHVRAQTLNTIPKSEVIENFHHEDSASFVQGLHKQVQKLRNRGYLLSNVEKMEGYYPDMVVEVYIGNRYEISSLQLNGIPTDIQRQLASKPKKYIRETYNSEEVTALFDEILTISERHGYPFANISIDSINVEGSHLHGLLAYQAGPLILFDSVRTNASFIKSSFLSAYLGAIHGSPYDQRVIDQIPDRLGRLPYLTQKAPASVTFGNEKAKVLVPVERRVANRLDGYLGFFPNTGADGDLLVTGKLDLALHNLFQSGKSLILFWEKQQVATQLFHLTYDHPNLFQSPVGLHAHINLYRQDSTFVNRKLKIGASFLSKLGRSMLFTSLESSRTLDNPDPEVLDFNLTNFGMEIDRPQVNGFSAEQPFQLAYAARGMVGEKDIRDRDSLASRSVQLNLQGRIELQKHLTGPVFVYGRLLGGFMQNQQLFRNDLFRLGGLKSIRGFYENEFYADSYVTASLEGRLYFAARSSLVAFFDVGSYSFMLNSDSGIDTPWGTGLGINVETQAGVLSLMYAVGKTKVQPLDLRFSKLHIGYIATF